MFELITTLTDGETYRLTHLQHVSVTKQAVIVRDALNLRHVYTSGNKAHTLLTTLEALHRAVTWGPPAGLTFYALDRRPI